MDEDATLRRMVLLLWVAAVLAAVSVAAGLVVVASGANVTVSVDPVGHVPDEEPELFYLFNRTTRRYEDVLQWHVGADPWVQLRVADGTARYKFNDRGWMSLHLDDTEVLRSIARLTLDGNSSKTVTFSLGNWTFTDRGETLEVWRAVKTKDHSLNESWTFSFKLGAAPKVTWDVEDLDAKARETRSLEWVVKFLPTTMKVKSLSRTAANVTRASVKNVDIDWADFGKSKVELSANATRREYVVAFHPKGTTADFEVDPVVSFTTTAMATQSWVTLGFLNPNNPSTTKDVVSWSHIDWFWVDQSAPGTEIPVDCNPFPVAAGATVLVRCYDMWGRSWQTNYFGSGAAGTYTRVEGDLPLCWISVQCWNGIRCDGFHRWAIRVQGGGYNWHYVDEPVKFPLIVDDGNQVNYEVWVPEDSWIDDAGTTTVTHGDVSGRVEYVANIDVDLKSEPTTVYIRLYDSSTGEGIPWERFVVKWDSTITPTNVIQAWTDESHDVEVEDFWGNDLYTATVSTWDAPIHLLKVPVTIYSVKLFNQQPDYVHKVSVYYNLVDGPYTEYIAPLEVVELHLKAADYRFDWVPYRNYVAQDTQRFDLSISEANYFLINGTTISRVVTDVAGVYALQEVLTTLVSPDLVYVLEDPPEAPCSDDLGIAYLHPYEVLRADVRYNGTGTSALLWTPHPDLAGRNYTVDRDVLHFSGPYATRIYVNWSSNGTCRYNLTHLPASLDLGDAGNYTLWTNNSVSWSREASWRQYTIFWWEYHISEHRYRVSRSANNTMNLTLRNVNWMVGWPEDVSVDLTGVDVFDIDNQRHLTRGEHYDATVGGVYMHWASLASGASRSFRVTAWDLNTTGLYDTPVITCVDAADEHYRDSVYKYCQGSWTNDYAVPYQGSILINLRIDETVKPGTVIVFDTNANREVPREHWVFQGSSITVTGQGVGEIAVGGTAAFKVYFKQGVSGEDAWLFTPVLLGFLSPWWLMVFLACGVTYAVYHFGFRSKSSRTFQTRVSLVLAAATLWSLLIITWMLNEMEVLH